MNLLCRNIKKTQCNSGNVKFTNPQLNELKPVLKNENGVPLTSLSNMNGDFIDETIFPHKLLLTDRQVWNVRKAFANN